MGIKDLFQNPQGSKVLSSEDFDREVQKVESLENMQAKFYEKRRFMPNVDFSEPRNFARYGLAADYYVDSVDRVIREYPYDGSLKERALFLNSSSYLDHYVFESRYPRTTGYAVLSADGWGSLDGSITGEYGKPASVEYIKILGGPNTASAGMPTGSLYQSFTGSNIYDTNIYNTDGMLANGRLGTRESNLQFSSTNGCTIEFWMRKFDYAGPALTKKEVIFDLWNQNTTGSKTTPSDITDNKYGRVTLELSASTHSDAGNDTFRLTVQSGSGIYGFFNQSIGASTVTTSSVTDKKWHHYAVTIASASTDGNHGTEVKFYVDGKLNNEAIYGTMGVGNITGSLVAHIGSLVGPVSGTTYTALSDMTGYGKLSASLDEFRYWKVTRTDEQIFNSYKYQVGGGTNTDISNTELGVYYKFNEGITQTSSIDSTVLDYSGRISNGKWTGYSTNSRNTGSAMVSASVVSKEYHDPIIYIEHPSVALLRDELESSGSAYDHENNSSLYYSMPDWITDEDQTVGTGELKKLSQILASHFDTLQLQIESLSKLKDTSYLSSSFSPAKPVPFADRLLTSNGFVAPEIFADADLVAQILSRDEEREFELDLADIKNFIYKNIYNNLVGIYKSKGTEKAFRNLIRCYGIGDEVVKLKAYGNNITHALEDTHYLTAVPKKTINFNDPDHFGATVFQNSGNNDEQRSVAVSGATAFTSDYTQRVDLPFTMECEVILPKKVTADDPEGYFRTDFVSSSICGWHRGLKSDVLSETLNTFHPDDYNLQMYAVRPEIDSDDAYFVLTGSNGNLQIAIETDTYKNVYNNEKWNLAARVAREKRIPSGRVSGSATGDIDGLITNTVVEFLGYNYDGDLLRNSFHLSGNTHTTGAIDLLNGASKRFYVGADRTGFSGSVITKSDVKASSLKYWQSFISNQALDLHARDVHNYGTLNPSRNAFLNSLFAEGNEIPEAETLALHWDFSQITGSDSDGRFLVQDASSGSVDLVARYSDLGKITKTQHAGMGYGFRSSSTSSVSVEYFNSAKQQLPEVINTSDAVNVLMADDDEFTRSSAVTQYYYAFEKNMYDTISQEMLNMFGTIADFNNLIGEPVYRYRHEYKAMNKLRSLFFERIGNTPDLDKYISYYKWIDDSLSAMLRRLAPVSADIAPDIRTIVESHILERNKYQHKYPIVDTRGNQRFGIDKEIEGTAKGVNELDYDWKHGHAPRIPQTTDIMGVAATATITVADGDAATGMTEGEKITITSTDGTAKVYRLCDDTLTTITTGAELAAGSDTGAGTTADDGDIAVVFNIASSEATQNAFLVQLKAAIEHANGHNGKITVSAVPTEATGAQLITLTQEQEGTSGNVAITDDISQTTLAGFTGGTDRQFIADQSNNALWWKERAERNLPIGVGENDLGLKAPTPARRPTEDASNIDREKEKFRQLISKYDFRSGHKLTQQDISDKALIYTGSAYAINRFARPYKLTADLRSSPPRDIRGGYNFDGTKNFDFVLNSVRAKTFLPLADNNKYYILTNNLEQEVETEDILKPAIIDSDGKIIEKKKATYFMTYGETPSTVGNDYANKFYVRKFAPFVLMSSSAKTGYQAAISHMGVEIVGLHTDGVVDGALQGPFAERHVGGLQYRHNDLNASGSDKSYGGPVPRNDGLDRQRLRGEGFKLLVGPSGLQISPPLLDKKDAYSPYYRYPVAKRPFNLANIRETNDRITLNGSTSLVSGTLHSRLGNFSRVNQVVFAGDRGTNNQAFVRNGGGSFVATASLFVRELIDYPKLVRDVAAHTVVERFSAPGSPETAGDTQGGAGLDYAAGQYSPYNNLNYRNLGVRLPLRTMLSGVTNQFGLRSGIGSQINENLYTGIANFHKVHRNTRQRLEYTNEFSSGPWASDGGIGTVATQSMSDNFFVSHMIPQSDLAYSWITSSYVGTNELGYMPPDGLSKAGVTHTGQQRYDASISFVSQSQEGSYIATAHLRASTIANSVPGPSQEGFVPTLFGTMNTNIIDVPNTSSALLGLPLSQSVLGYFNVGDEGLTTFEVGAGGAAETVFPRNSFIQTIPNPASDSLPDCDGAEVSAFHQLMLFRNGPYGHPTWRQIRVGDNRLTRLLRENNKISVMIPAEEKINDNPTVNEDHLTAVAQQRAKRGSTRNFIEPAVVMRHYPLEYKFTYETRNNRGKPVNKNVLVNCTHGNDKVKFTNNRLNNMVDFHSGKRRITGYDHIKDFYLDGALEEPDSPIKKFISLKYKEKVYPAERNLGLGKTRKRNKYQNTFWRTQRSDRTVAGVRGINPFSNEYSYNYSRWPLDAGINFEFTGTANMRTETVTYAQGMLQNGWLTQCYEYGHAGDGGILKRMRPGPLYNRFHILSSTSSVVAPSGMQIPETGSELGNVWDGDSYLPGQYQFSGAFETEGAILKGPTGFPGHSASLSHTHLGSALWQADKMAGRVKTVDGITKFVHEPTEPFYDSYNDYLEDLEPHNKGMSVIPEFRISDHIDFYVKQNSEDFLVDNPQFLSIPGASTSDGIPINSSGSSFYKIFSFSDFMKHFRLIKSDHEELADPTEITLECRALKKFLPYDGFYPATRTVQIAGQWSSSYGPYISAGGNHFDNLMANGGEHVISRPLMQAFFAPGILYNSIKAGIACDWPCVTGSTGRIANILASHGPTARDSVRSAMRRGHGTGSRGEKGWDFRVPFEALVEPEKYIANMAISDMEAEAEFARIQLSASWSGQGDKLYKMMMNNFLAETTRFFLKGQKMTRITSADETKFKAATSGTIYTARVKMYRSMNDARPMSGAWGDYPIPQDPIYELITGVGDGSAHVNGKRLGTPTGLRETFTMYSRPSAFGPPVVGFDDKNQNQTDPQIFDSATGFNPSFTPPYYHGEAWADIIWQAKLDGRPSLDEIFESAKVYNIRIDGEAFWSPGATGSTDNSHYEGYEFPMASGAANAYSMQMVHSLNLFGKGKKPSIKRRRGGAQDSDELEDKDVWVIEPKWETPMYNFNTSGIAGERMYSGSDPQYNLIIPSASSGQGTVPRGMWHQFGVIPTSSEVGIFMQIEDVPLNWVDNAENIYGIIGKDGRGHIDASLPSQANPGLTPSLQAYNAAESLVDLCGFRSGARRLGETAHRRKISEAIAAIPFYVEQGEVKYFDIDLETIEKARLNIEQETKGSELESIEDMLRKMDKFVFPPKFDFGRNPEVTPVSMYIFEFSHLLDQNDLSHIWQNLPPKIGRKSMKARSTIKHRLLGDALMGSTVADTGERMRDKVQWMVFKVKQRAETDYFKITSNTTPQLFHAITNAKLEESAAQAALAEIRYEHEENPAIPNYSYNWPYDFFSLIEFASLDAEVTFETPEVEDENADPQTSDLSTVARELKGVSKSAALTGLSLEETLTIGEEAVDLVPAESPFSAEWYESDVKSSLRDIAGISEDD